MDGAVGWEEEEEVVGEVVLVVAVTVDTVGGVASALAVDMVAVKRERSQWVTIWLQIIAFTDFVIAGKLSIRVGRCVALGTLGDSSQTLFKCGGS